MYHRSGNILPTKEQTFRLWTIQRGIDRMLPYPLEQELIFVPCGLGQSLEYLSGSHWGLVVFTRLQVMS